MSMLIDSSDSETELGVRSGDILVGSYNPLSRAQFRCAILFEKYKKKNLFLKNFEGGT